MTLSTVQRILADPTLKDSSMSMGFRRYTVLPRRVKLDIFKGFYAKTGSSNDHDYNVSLFENMSDAEYLKYLKNA